MIRFTFSFLLIVLYSLTAWGQVSKVIELEPVEINPSDKVFVYSSFSNKREGAAKALGSEVSNRIAIVSGFSNPEKFPIQLEGLEFHFNYEWGQDSSGFYIQPVVVKEEEGVLIFNYTDTSERFLAKSILGNRLYIDLSSKNINLAPKERLLLGIKFLENVNSDASSVFSVTLTNGRAKDYTYLLYSESQRLEQVFSPGKHSAGLKYSVVYKLKE